MIMMMSGIKSMVMLKTMRLAIIHVQVGLITVIIIQADQALMKKITRAHQVKAKKRPLMTTQVLSK